jgi:hypothetical protein
MVLISEQLARGRFRLHMLAPISILTPNQVDVASKQVVLAKLQGPTMTAPAANYLVAEATQQIMDRLSKTLLQQQAAVTSAVSLFFGMKQALHSYAVDTDLLELGDVAESF